MTSTFSADPDSLAQRALQHMQAGQTQEAEALYRQVLERQPLHRAALSNLAELMSLRGNRDEAIAYYRRLLALAGAEDDAELHRNLGDALLERGDPAAAIVSYQNLLRLKPDNTSALTLIGGALAALNRHDEAISWYRKALAIKPDLVITQWQLGVALMLHGDYAAGLPLYEKRLEFEMKFWPQVEKFSSKPTWDGRQLQGRTVLVWAEQGMGDNIMMMRYLPLLRQKGAGSVIVYCHPVLVKTMLTMTGLVISTEADISNESFDTHCSMMSLPYLFGTTLHTIPANIPYLQPPAAMQGKWAKQLKRFPGLKVGIAWAANKHTDQDLVRSVPLRLFAPLMALSGIQYVSLQKEDVQQQLQECDWRVLDWMEASDDLLDTAALIANLDLVITVDTVVVHLAGALGKPVWLLNRFESEWRWLKDRDDSPWYSGLRIFRQPAARDWESVMKKLAAELGKLNSDTPASLAGRQWEKAARAADKSLGIDAVGRRAAPFGIGAAKFIDRLLPERWRRSQ